MSRSVRVMAGVAAASCAIHALSMESASAQSHRDIEPFVQRSVDELVLKEDFVFGFGDSTNPDGALGQVFDVAVDSDGVVHVLDRGFSCVHRFSESGDYLGKYGAEGEGPGDFRRPQAIAIGPGDRVYVGGFGSLIAEFTADGTPVASHKRAESTFGCPVSSITADSEGYVYVCSVDVLHQKVIFKHDPVDFALVESFGDTYAVGHDVDTRAERVFGGGFVDVTQDGELLFAQMTPPEIRLYSLSGDVLVEFSPRDVEGFLPEIAREEDRITFFTPEMMSGQIISMNDGKYIASMKKPSRDENVRRTGFEGSIYVDMYDGCSRRIKSIEYRRLFSPQCVDVHDRLYVIENRPRDDSEYPVVVRYIVD